MANFIAEKLNAVYSRLSNAYYGFSDALSGKGIPLNSLNEFLEGKGIPAFPFVVALVVALLFLVGSFVSLGLSQTVEARMTLLSANQPLTQVLVSVKDLDGKQLAAETINSGDLLKIAGVKFGQGLELTASKKGFKIKKQDLTVSGPVLEAMVSLEADVKSISAKIRLNDALTNTLIDNGQLSIEFEGTEVPVVPLGNGTYELIGVPEGSDVRVKIKAEGYEEIDEVLRFNADEEKEISLQPKMASLAGSAKILFTVKDKESGQALKDALVKVFDSKTEIELAEELTDAEGQALVALNKGAVARIVVEKEGFVSFDSRTEGKELTLRADQEEWNIELLKGGAEVRVSVISAVDKIPLQDALVVLWNSEGQEIKSEKTGLSGEIDFNGLKADEYFATAWAEGFLPERKSFKPVEARELTLALTQVTADNSGKLGVFATDLKKEAITNAQLAFFELSAGKKLPLGLKGNTDATGYFEAGVGLGKSVLVEASKELLFGDANISIAAGFNQLIVLMKPKENVLTIKFVDEQGNALDAVKALITTESGTVLFDGLIDKQLQVDAAGLTRLNVSAEKNELRTEEQFTVSGKTELMVVLSQKTFSEAQVKLLRILDETGTEVGGFSKGKEFLLEFETNWPIRKIEGGFFIVVGDESKANADSGTISVTGFDSVNVDSINYGRTFSQAPLPGNESIDRQNTGTAGKDNKWLELKWNDASQAVKKVIGVRVKVKGNSPGLEQVHYRVWTKSVLGKYSRDPSDAVLGEEAFNAQKLGLYAETYSKNIQVFNELPKCVEGICFNSVIASEDGAVYKAEEFTGIKEKVYALELELFGLNDLANNEVNFEARKLDPIVLFQGSQSEQFSWQQDLNRFDTSIKVSANEIGLIKAGEKKKLRAYFKAIQEGQAIIDLTIKSGLKTLKESIALKIEKEKSLAVSIKQGQELSVGEDFEITVKDLDSGEPVRNALIEFYSLNELVYRIQGTEVQGNGLNGIYLIKQDIESGVIDVKVKAKNYQDSGLQLKIGVKGVIKLDESIEIFIPSGSKNASALFKARNTSSKPVQELNIWLEKDSEIPGLELKVDQLLELRANEERGLALTASYDGELKDFHVEGKLHVDGVIAGKQLTSSTAKYSIDFGKQLPSTCLAYSKNKLTVFVVGAKGVIADENFSIKNSCDQKIDLNLSVMPSKENSENMPTVLVNNVLSLYPQDEKSVLLNVQNNEDLVGLEAKEFDYKVLVDSREVASNSVDLKVVVWNQGRSLDIIPYNSINLLLTPGVEKWYVERLLGLGQEVRAMTGDSTGSNIVYLRNNGREAISDLRLSIQGISSQAGVDIQFAFLEAFTGGTFKKEKASLGRGEQVAIGLRARTNTLKDKGVTDSLIVSGRIAGKEITKAVPIYVLASKPDCVFVEEGFIVFADIESKQGALQKVVNVRNECVEEVSIQGLEYSAGLAGNNLSLIPLEGELIGVGEHLKFNLVLEKTADYASPEEGDQVRLALNYVRSNRKGVSKTFSVKTILGTKFLEGEASKKIAVLKQCENPSIEETLFMPIVYGASCEKSFCDAKRISGKLINEMNELARRAKGKIGFLKNAAPSSCASASSCSFVELGVEPELHAVFMQNDRMAAVFESLLQEELKAGTGETKGWVINPLAVEKTDVKEFVAGGYGKRVFLQDKFKGCGKYSYYLVGGVATNFGQLDAEQMVMGIIVEGPQKASECLEQVQNFQNFLPENKGYGIGSMKASWAGLVQRSPEDKLVAEEIAEALFNNKARAVGSGELLDYQTNLLALAVDKTDKETILKLILPKKTPKGEAVVNPLTIQAIVGERGLKETQGKTAAGNALKNLMQGGSLQGCITADHSELRISDVEKPTNLKIEGCDLLKLLVGTSYCDFKVSRNIFDKVKISLEGIGKLEGKTSFKLQEKVFTGAVETPSGEKIYKLTDVELGKALIDLKADEAKEFRLVASSRNEAVLIGQAEQTISLIALSSTDGQSTKKEIKLKACGITAEEMVGRVIKLEEPGTYYATISSLPEGKDKASLCSLLQRIPDKELSKEWIAKSGCTGNKGTAYKGKVAGDKAIGLAAYEGACWATCGLCVGATGWIPIIGWITAGAQAADCAWACVPAGVLGLGDLVYSNWDEVTSAASGAFGGWGRDIAGGVKAASDERENVYYDLTESAVQTTPIDSSIPLPGAIVAAAGTLGKPAYSAQSYIKTTATAARELTAEAGTKVTALSGSVDEFVKLNAVRLTPQTGIIRIKKDPISGVFKPEIAQGTIRHSGISYDDLTQAVNNAARELDVEGKTLAELTDARGKQLVKSLGTFDEFVDEAAKAGVAKAEDVKALKDATNTAKTAIDNAAKATNAAELTNAAAIDKVKAVATASNKVGIGKWGRIWQGLLKVRGGLACGLAGNLVGANAYTFTIEARARQLTGRVVFTNAASDGKELVLQKNSTVKIVVDFDKETGEKRISLAQVTSGAEFEAIKPVQRIDDCVEENYFSWKKKQKGTK